MLVLWMACTWVGPDDFEQRLSELDDDGDSFTRDAGDCDDADSSIFPGADEIWYDGIDQDCAGNDDYDQDNDGFRQADAPDVGDDPDCNDKNADIYPFAPDTWYDNVDADCQENDDFDADGDGFRSKTGGGADCDDEPADDADHGGPTATETFPGAPDTWYDGVDQDCAGDDDFDQDTDGYVPEEYFDGDDPPETRWCASCGTGNKGDCDDDPTDDDSSLIPAIEVFNGQPDTWYDGVDQDCAGDDDFDQDLDGFAADDQLSNGQVPDTEHCLDCPLSIPGDCDDTNADYFLGAIEDPSTSDDQDCDGGSASVGVDSDTDIGWILTDPYALRAAENATELWFSVNGRRIEDQDATTYDDTAVAFSFSFANPDLGLQSISNWQAPGSSFDITGGQSFAIEGTDFVGATGLQGSSSRVLVVSRTPNGGSRESVAAPQTLLTAVEDIDIAVDIDGDGVVHAVSCDELTGFHYVRAEDGDFSSGSSGTFNLLYSSFAPQACSLHISGNTGILAYSDDNDNGAVALLSFDSSTVPTFTEVSRISNAVDVELVDAGGEMVLVLADSSAGVIEVQRNGGTEFITPPAPPVSVQVAVDPLDSDILYIGWADVNGDAGLAWGEVGVGFDTGSFTTLHSVIETVPWVSPDGADLFVGLMGSLEISVERVTPPS